MASAKSKTPQEYHSDTVRLTSRMFWAPDPVHTILPGILLSLLGGLLLVAPEIDWYILRYAIAFFGVPTLLMAVLSKIITDALGGKTYTRRTALLALSGLAISVGTIGLIRFVEALYSFATLGSWNARYVAMLRAIVISWGVPLWLSVLVFLSTSDSRMTRSIPPASIQVLFSYLIVFAYFRVTVSDIVLAILVFMFFLTSAILFAEIANRPLRKSFGYDGLWLMGQFLNHMTERGSASQTKVESFFETISIPAQIHLGTIAFGSPPRYKAIIVAPSAHPGPLGSLGGSALPSKLSEQLAEMSPAVLVPKGPSTHDQNIATFEECTRIGYKTMELLREAESSTEGSKSATATVGKAMAVAQFFGDKAFVVCSLAPNPTDDIDSATGHAARQESKFAGASDTIFIDAHNCMEVGSGLTHFGSRASYDIVEASKKAIMNARKHRVKGIQVGYASRPYTGNPDNGLGPMGIQVLIVQAGDQKTAYVLFDGNNMIPGLRERVIEATSTLVDVTEVLTSDDHVVNMTIGGFNPVGMKMNKDDLVKMARNAVVEALRDLSDTQSSFVTGTIDDLKIFGPEASARLTTGVNLTVAMLRPAVVLSLALAITLSVLALVLI